MPNTQLMLFIVLIGVAIMLTVFAGLTHIYILNSILALIALALILVAFLTKNYYYLVDSIVNKKGKDLVLNANEAFVLSPSGTSIIRREKDNVYASSFIKIPLYKSGTEMNKEEKLELSRLFARILTLSKSPVRISSQLYVVNKDEYIAKLHNMLNESEERYRRMQSMGSGDSQRNVTERARGEVTMWRNILDSVSGSKSQSLLLYAMVTALGSTDDEANNIAYQKAEEFAGGVSTILGVNAFVVTGDEIIKLIEPEYMIPIETVNQRLKQKM